MPQNENQFRNSIHKHLKGKRIHHEKMHNPFRSGTPDDWYSGFTCDLWVEYKYRIKLGSITVSNLLSALQYHWLTGRHEEGRNVAVIVGFPQGGIVVRPLEFDRKIPVLEVESRLKKRQELADWILDFTGGE